MSSDQLSGKKIMGNKDYYQSRQYLLIFQSTLVPDKTKNWIYDRIRLKPDLNKFTQKNITLAAPTLVIRSGIVPLNI